MQPRPTKKARVFPWTTMADPPPHTLYLMYVIYLSNVYNHMTLHCLSFLLVSIFEWMVVQHDPIVLCFC